MNVFINNKEYTYTADVKSNIEVKNSFNELIKKTYGLEFDGWGDSYIPHVLLDNKQVVANVSVNRLDFKWQGEWRHYIQLGTVATADNYRMKGLGRWLIERILAEWGTEADTVYLFANDSVLQYYPKFGFEVATEYQHQKSIAAKSEKIRKLDMSLLDDQNILLNAYRQSNAFSALKIENNEFLLMMYCMEPMKDNVYYIESYGVVVIASYYDETMICYDIYGATNHSLDDILSAMSNGKTQIAILGFTPHQAAQFNVNEYHKEDTTLFILKGKENLFANNQMMFPVLSHT